MPSPTLAALTTACELDPDGGGELLRFTLFEALADLTDRYGPVIDREISKAFHDTRPGLVRQYVAKRLANESVDELLAAATVVSKDYDPEETRDPRGRWSKTGNKHLDMIGAFVSGTNGQEGRPGARLADVVGPNSSGYKRLALAGQALTAAGAAGGQPHIAALGLTAQLAGELGPQAEIVLGPSMKRTAYRYRGTERTPDAQLQKETHLLAKLSPAVLDDNVTMKDLTAVRDRPDRNRISGNSAAAIAEYYAGGGGDTADGKKMTIDQVRLAMTGDYNAVEMQKDIPSLQHAKLSLHAGKMPPSTGVIIDRDGDVVSQAQGYNGDHYLPFDLTNLKRLQGGSYVRTRTTGGPTDEDIYTALMTGARQIQVVSHSGVFTVEFDPNTRGARRYSDKARDMVDRYAKLLTSVNSGELLQKPFSAEDIQADRDKAWRLSGHNGKRARELFDTYQQERRENLAFTPDNSAAEGRAGADDIARATIARGGMTSNQSQARDTRDLTGLSRDQAAKVYRLDGEGYEAALTALQGEFPYYIRATRFEPWNEFQDRRNIPRGDNQDARVSDIGYTRRRGLEPTRVIAARERTRGEQTPTTAAAAVAAPAASVASGAPSEQELDNSGLERELARSLARSLPAFHTVGNWTVPDMSADETDALGEGDGAYAIWLTGKQPTPEDQAKWLMNASPQHVAKLRASLVALNEEMDGLDDGKWQQRFPGVPDAIAALDKLSLIRAPYAATTLDPVLTAGTKPQLFPDVAALPFNRASAVNDYLAQNEGVGVAYAEIAGLPDAQIAKVVAGQVDQYKKLRQWGEEIHDPDDPEAIDNPLPPLTIDDADEAEEVAASGVNHQRYQDLANLQKAWAVKRGVEIAQILRGGAADAGPKDPLAKRLSSPSPQVVVHRLGSPASRALSKRLTPPPGVLGRIQSQTFI